MMDDQQSKNTALMLGGGGLLAGGVGLGVHRVSKAKREAAEAAAAEAARAARRAKLERAGRAAGRVGKAGVVLSGLAALGLGASKAFKASKGVSPRTYVKQRAYQRRAAKGMGDAVNRAGIGSDPAAVAWRKANPHWTDSYVPKMSGDASIYAFVAEMVDIIQGKMV